MEKNKISFATILSITFVYVTLSGCLWHLGYWSTFKFNYLEFANISDLFKSAIYPFFKNIWILIGLSFFGIVNGALIHYSFLQKGYSINSNLQQPTYKKITALLILLSSTVALFFSGIFFSTASYIHVFPISVAILLGCFLYNLGLIKNLINDDAVRLLFLILIVVFPAINFSVAKKQSFLIKSMLRYNEVSNVITSDSLASKSISHTAFLGSTSGYHFFFNSTEVIIVKSENIVSFSLQEVEVDSNYSKFLKIYK